MEYSSHTVALSKGGRHRMVYTGGCEIVCSVGKYIPGEAINGVLR